ncbi:hypothetical protein GBAR_LOCUS18117 [Geodia barretti]|uniref:Uncharacterized protein n=1 Tax=Geodia barretti TaxID=519541 RepID=A0AA35SLX4_GEOBA|nr:hypothetical protein GBAR_LOCUS18117 [Geodia barretti]
MRSPIRCSAAIPLPSARWIPGSTMPRCRPSRTRTTCRRPRSWCPPTAPTPCAGSRRWPRSICAAMRPSPAPTSCFIICGRMPIRSLSIPGAGGSMWPATRTA